MLSGTINSGKTTCARRLVKRLAQPALVEVDQFFQFFPGQDIVEVSKSCLLAATAAIKRLAQLGHDVVVPYPLWRDDLLLILEELDDVATAIHLVTLVPHSAAVLGSRSKRKDKTWEQAVVQWHHELGVQRPVAGVVIDNTHQRSAETVRDILAAVRSGASLIDPDQVRTVLSSGAKIEAPLQVPIGRI